MIRIAPSTLRVEQSFIDAILKMHQIYLDLIDNGSRGDAERRKGLLAANPSASQRALDAVRGVKDTRRGLSYDINTRFEVADEYTRLYAATAGGVAWLCGDTKDITIHGSGYNVNAGTYTVAYRVDSLGAGRLDRAVHFIPQRAPREGSRHPHHYCTPIEGKSPLEFITSTCWGGFSSRIMNCISERDIAGLFHMSVAYLSRYNGGSPLRRIQGITWLMAQK